MDLPKVKVWTSPATLGRTPYWVYLLPKVQAKKSRTGSNNWVRYPRLLASTPTLNGNRNLVCSGNRTRDKSVNSRRSDRPTRSQAMPT